MVIRTAGRIGERKGLSTAGGNARVVWMGDGRLMADIKDDDSYREEPAYRVVGRIPLRRYQSPNYISRRDRRCCSNRSTKFTRRAAVEELIEAVDCVLLLSLSSSSSSGSS